MGNVCRPKKQRDTQRETQDTKTIRIPYDEFPNDREVCDDDDMSGFFDDTMFKDYIQGECDVVEKMTAAGSSFLAKRPCSLKQLDTLPKSPPQLELMYFRGAVALPLNSFSMSDSDTHSMPSLSSRKSTDSKNFGFQIQDPRPYPFCFRNNKIPKGSPRCFDSDAGSHVSLGSKKNNLILDLNTPPSYKNEKFYCSPLLSPLSTPSRPPTPRAHKRFWSNMNDDDSSQKSDDSGTSQGSQTSQTFDKTKWIWTPQVKQHPQVKHPPITPIVFEKKGS